MIFDRAPVGTCMALYWELRKNMMKPSRYFSQFDKIWKFKRSIILKNSSFYFSPEILNNANVFGFLLNSTCKKKQRKTAGAIFLSHMIPMIYV